MINLLPLEQKKNIHNEKRKRISLVLLFFLVIYLFFATTVLYTVKYFSFKVLNEERQNIQQERERFKNVLEKKESVDNLNKRVFKIKNLKEKRISLTKLLVDISNSITKETKLSSFQYDIKDKTHQITISGYTPNWEHLLTIEKELKSRFKNVNFSSESWTQTEDITFSVKFEKNDKK